MEWMFTEDLEERRVMLEQYGFDAYCLHTKAGWEAELSTEMNRLHDDILVLPFMKTTHRSVRGKKSTYQETKLPGYVFLFSRKGERDICWKKGHCYYSFVRNEDGTTLLRGGDRKYAEWVFYNGGLIGLSKAIRVDGRVRIIEGPLFDVRGNIKEYSRKNRNCRVEITLFNRTVSMWLPFQWVEAEKEGS